MEMICLAKKAEITLIYFIYLEDMQIDLAGI